jgi:hypothetical protein
MTKLKLLPAALIAAAMLTTPVMARDNHLKARGASYKTSMAAPRPAARYIDGRRCTRAPREGAFASQPWSNPPCEPASGY